MCIQAYGLPEEEDPALTQAVTKAFGKKCRLNECVLCWLQQKVLASENWDKNRMTSFSRQSTRSISG